MSTVSVKTLRSLAADAVAGADYSAALNYALQAQALGSLSRAKKGESEMEWPPNELQEFIKNMERQIRVAAAETSGSGGFQTTKFVYANPQCGEW